MLTIIDSINDVALKFKSFIVENQRNPLLWTGLFFGGILIFSYTYNKLNKNK